MAHFAELVDGIVQRVIVVDDAHEADGERWCAEFAGGEWKQTSYNNNIRKQYAGIGYKYDPDADVFIAPQPFPSWSLDSNHEWQPPKPKPSGLAIWNELTLSWDQ